MNKLSKADTDDMIVSSPNKLRILILADIRNKTASTVFDHVDAFVDYSKHDVDVLNVAGQEWPGDLSFEYYDVLILHYSICIIYDWFMPDSLVRAVKEFSGLKIQYLQDEYRQVNKIVDKALELDIDVLYSVLFPETAEVVYKKLIDAGVEIRYTLTGYVSNDMIEYKTAPIVDRKLDATYRGRPAPFIMGELGYEKTWIGQKFLKCAENYDLKCDIAWREEDRIYGDGWLQFNASSRVSLGTESGAYIADFESRLHNSIEAYQVDYPECSYKEIFESVIKPYEGNMDMTGISPRVFEAMALKTGLVMFPGRYSDLLVPDKHYILLEKDFSNFEEVVAKIKDDTFLQEMVDRNYEEFIASGSFSFKSFIQSFDRELDEIWNGSEPERVQKNKSFSACPGNIFAKGLWFLSNTKKQLFWSSAVYKICMRTCNPRYLLARSKTVILKILVRVYLLLNTVFILGPNGRLINLTKKLNADQELTVRKRFMSIKIYSTLHAINRHCMRKQISYNCTIVLSDEKPITISSNESGVMQASEGTLNKLAKKIFENSVLEVRFNRQKNDFNRLAIFLFPFFNWPFSLVMKHTYEDAEVLSKLILNWPMGEAEKNRGTILVGFIRSLVSHVISIASPPMKSFYGNMRVANLFKRQKSVVFLNNAYYCYFLLARELRKRGWDAISVSMYPPDDMNAGFYQGEDVNIYDANPGIFKNNARELFQLIKSRYRAVHFYGINMMHFSHDQAENVQYCPVLPEDFIQLKQAGVKIGYSVVGCNDGVAQSSWSRWTGGMCEHCVFKDDNNTCSDVRNLAWGYKVNMFCDLIAGELMPRLDYLATDKVVNVPFTYCVDDNQWHPDLGVPEKYLLKKKNDEIIVMHAVGNYELRSKASADPKGTRVIKETVKKLRKDGYNVRLEFVTGVPSTDMKYLQVQADIIVDQLYFGRYGAITRECLMLGRPVVSSMNKDLKNETDPEMRELLRECPVVHGDASNLYGVLKDLILNKRKRQRISKKSRAYALKWHSVEACADRFEHYYAQHLDIK